ncbi:hypothetical protein V2G26_016877 [Clonostachys chloroleuca]
MVSQPQNPNSSQPRPLFGAELEARPPDGNPVFEMSGESAPSKDDNSTNNIYPGRKETGLNSQAHPWPFYLDEQGQRRPIMEEDGRPQAAANDDNDAVPAALAIKFAGRPAGSDASAEVRPLVMRPASPAETDSFIPAPLNISRPSQSSPPPLSPRSTSPISRQLPWKSQSRHRSLVILSMSQAKPIGHTVGRHMMKDLLRA